MHIELFPPEIIALNEELATGYHPKLEAMFNDPENPINANDFPQKLGLIAGHVGVALDGMYTVEECVAMVNIILPRLKELRERKDHVIIVKEL